jgi:hypothetical protein
VGSPTTRSLQYLRELGWTVAVVEHWNPFARVRRDLWGFADLIAFRGGTVLLVQTTSDANVAARRKKVEKSSVAAMWLSSPRTRRVEVHGWKKVKGRWRIRVVNIRL